MWKMEAAAFYPTWKYGNNIMMTIAFIVRCFHKVPELRMRWMRPSKWLFEAAHCIDCLQSTFRVLSQSAADWGFYYMFFNLQQFPCQRVLFMVELHQSLEGLAVPGCSHTTPIVQTGMMLPRWGSVLCARWPCSSVQGRFAPVKYDQTNLEHFRLKFLRILRGYLTFRGN